MTKILFVSFPILSWNCKPTKLANPHIGVAYLSSWLKKDGIDTSVCDLSLHIGNEKEALAAAINHHNPDWLGFTIYSPLAAFAKEMIAFVRSISKAKICVGGPHISCDRANFIRDTGVDVAIGGEGELALLRLLQGGKDNDGALQFIQDLDVLPFPDYSIFEVEKYQGWRDGNYQIITSRGCPFNCSYCAGPVHTSRNWRGRSTQNIINELKLAKSQGFYSLSIIDDCFNLDMDRAKNICREMISAKLDFTWVCSNGLRADRVDQELADLLAQAGCTFVGIGVESGNPEILKRIRKGIKLENVQRAVEIFRKAGVGVAGSFIIGHPGETPQTAADTLKFAKEFGGDYVNIFSLLPFPGTRAYSELVEESATFLHPPEYYLSHYTTQSTSPLFYTASFGFKDRRKALVAARRLTQKSAMHFRLGKFWGTILYVLTLWEPMFHLVNSIRDTRLGTLYEKIKRHSHRISPTNK